MSRRSVLSLLRSQMHKPRPRPCIFCQFQQLPPQTFRPLLRIAHYATSPSSDRTSLFEQRVDLDSQARLEKFRQAVKDGVIVGLAPQEVERLVKSFIRSHADGAEQLAKIPDFNVEILTIRDIAITLLNVPDIKPPELSSPNSPPSLNRLLGHVLLYSCSQAGDAVATLHLMSSIYASKISGKPTPASKDLSRKEVDLVRKSLEYIAREENNIDALTLLAQLYLHERRSPDAEELLEKAVSLPIPSTPKKSTRGTAPPKINSPFAAYGAHLLSKGEQAGSSQFREKARAMLEKGALEADDPLCYYMIGLLEEENGYTEKWLECMNKAAASGHPDAMYRLGEFYIRMQQELDGDVEKKPTEDNSSPEKHVTSNLKLAKNATKAETVDRKERILSSPWLLRSLSWLTSPAKPSVNAESLACEWHELGAQMGSKPSMLAMARWMAKYDILEGAVERLVAVLSSTSSDTISQSGTATKKQGSEIGIVPAEGDGDAQTIQEARNFLKQLKAQHPEVQRLVDRRVSRLKSEFGGGVSLDISETGGGRKPGEF